MLVVMLKLFPRVSWAEGTAVTVKKMQKKKKRKKGFISILERKMNGIPPIIEERLLQMWMDNQLQFKSRLLRNFHLLTQKVLSKMTQVIFLKCFKIAISFNFSLTIIQIYIWNCINFWHSFYNTNKPN